MQKRNILDLKILLSIIGLIDAIYLSWAKIQQTELFCGGSSSCDTVNSSKFAIIFGVPLAYLGLIAYLVIIIILIMEKRSIISKELATYALLGITLIGSLFSVYLTYLEIYVIFAVCPYCMVSAVVMFLLFALVVVDLVKVLRV